MSLNPFTQEVSFQGVRNLQITSRLFTKPRSRAQLGAGVSTPLNHLPLSQPAWQAARSAAQREITCYLKLRAAPRSSHGDLSSAREAAGVGWAFRDRRACERANARSGPFCTRRAAHAARASIDAR